MSIEIVKDKCCGCRTCRSVCPKKAITFELDQYGFEFPSIDASVCNNCGKCETVCPALHLPLNKSHFQCGAAFATDSNIKFNGSSGGLFGVFALKTISEGGIVFGAAFDTSLKLKTCSAQTEEELLPLYKSKYLLCDTDNKFIQIKQELDCGRKVLYCSSPCQVAALKLFLKVEYENLILVDFVCHGVGNQTLFDKSIQYSQSKIGAEIKKVIFRYKVKNASSHYYYYYYYCGKQNKSFEKTNLYLFFPYYNAYCKQLACRDSCYLCQYATENRASDITIGDFHTIEKYDKSIDRFAGVSMFVCNTAKGGALFESVSDRLNIKPLSWNILRINNRFNNENGHIPAECGAFRESIRDDSFEKTISRFLKPVKDWRRLIYYKFPEFIRNYAKKIFGE